MNGICNALKFINTKQQSKIYSLYKINSVHKNIKKKEENNNTENEKEEKENMKYIFEFKGNIYNINFDRV